MKPAQIPQDEEERLAALRRLCLLDTRPSESFDRITRLTARALDVPIVLVSLVEDTRQWFLSRVGLDGQETAKEVSFCAHVVYDRAPLIVPDATLDARFSTNPLVTGETHIRAYGGIPLSTREGHIVGTLCAIDRQDRDFDEDDIDTLRDFALMVEDLIHAQEIAVHAEKMIEVASDQAVLFRATFELAAVGMVHLSPSGLVLLINGCACNMLGFDAEELQGKSFIDLTHPEDLATSTAKLQQLLAGLIESYRIEKRYIRKDGTVMSSLLSVSLKRMASGAPQHVIAVIEDLSAIKAAEALISSAKQSLETQVAEQTQKLHESNQALRVHVKRLLESEASVRRVEHRLRAVANSLPALIGYWNRELICEFANETYGKWFDLPTDRIVGRTMRDVLGEALFQAALPHTRAVLKGQARRFESQSPTIDGKTGYVDVHYMPDVAEDGIVRGFFVLITDITTARNVQRALEEANAKLANDSATDYLTGIANRRVFSVRSEEAFRRCKKHDEGYGLILLDLDNFKQINDGFGHDAGDEVLKCVGKLLKAQLRSHCDVAARLGGEEFGMLCFGHLDGELLVQVAERIRSLIHLESLRHEKRPLQFTGSFGLGLSNPTDADCKAIYSRADAALYQAKAAGKNCVVLSTEGGPAATGHFRSLDLMT